MRRHLLHAAETAGDSGPDVALLEAELDRLRREMDVRRAKLAADMEGQVRTLRSLGTMTDAQIVRNVTDVVLENSSGGGDVSLLTWNLATALVVLADVLSDPASGRAAGSWADSTIVQPS